MTPWTAACQGSLSITNSWSSLRLMSIESVMPSSHLILCLSLLLLPPIPPSIESFPFYCFLYFFALITEEGFLISPYYSLELCIQMGISFLSSCFSLLFLYSSSFIGLLRQPFYFFAFVFLGDGLESSLLYNVRNLCSSSGTLSIISSPLKPIGPPMNRKLH